MLLNELVGYKSNNKSLVNVLQDLFYSGKIEIAGGAFAIVLMPKGKPYVYRVWSTDRGYERYLKYVAEHSDNEHLIKVLSKVKTIKVNFKGTALKELSVVKLEKLQHIHHTDYNSVSTFLDKIKDDYDADSGNLPKSFATTVIDVLKSNAFGDVRNDLHTANIMKRGSTFVITDPFAPYEENSIIVDGNLQAFSSD